MAYADHRGTALARRQRHRGRGSARLVDGRRRRSDVGASWRDRTWTAAPPHRGPAEPPTPHDWQDRTDGGGRRSRGRLTVYLGAAPGVGKTYAMLGGPSAGGTGAPTSSWSGVRRNPRPPAPPEDGRGLGWIAAAEISYRGTTFTRDGRRRGDRAAARRLRRRTPRTNITAAVTKKRAGDVEVRRASIDVITTVSIQHLGRSTTRSAHHRHPPAQNGAGRRGHTADQISWSTCP